MKEEYKNHYRRWYDKDPILSSAVSTLEHSDDETQIKISLNLIKIIIEHNIEDEKYEAVEDIINAVGSGICIFYWNGNSCNRSCKSAAPPEPVV